MVSLENCKLERLGDIITVYPAGYRCPNFFEAILSAKLPKAKEVFEACMERASVVPQELMIDHDLSREDAAAIALYTFDYGPTVIETENLYRKLDLALNGRTVLELRAIRDVLFCLMRALRKLPRVTVPTLYRSSTNRVIVDGTHYSTGNKVTWHRMASTTRDLDVTKNFIRNKTTGVVAGTLFEVNDALGL